MTVDAAEFIGVKSFKAKGKRLTTFQIGEISEIDPNPEAAAEEVKAEETAEATEAAVQTEEAEPEAEPEKSDEELRDEITGQKRIF